MRCFLWLSILSIAQAWNFSLSRRDAILIATTPVAVHAAPPIAIMADELGYLPVTNSNGHTIYIPRPVQRTSTPQAVQLATWMAQQPHTYYTAYWCPHCARQRELWGRAAWALLHSVECDAKGYQSSLCRVDGYPTLTTPTHTISGERDLYSIAQELAYPHPFDPQLEGNLPPPIGAAACQLR